MRRIRNRGEAREVSRRSTGCRAVLAGVLVLAVMLALVAPGVALAGRSKAKKPTALRPPRHESLPPMAFLAGELQHDGRGGWTLEGAPLAFAPGGGLQGAGGEEGAILPRDGDRALLMGYWAGGAFVVRHGLVEDPFGGRIGSGIGGQEAIRAVDPRSEAARDIPQ